MKPLFSILRHGVVAFALGLLPLSVQAQGLPDNILQADILPGWQSKDGTRTAGLRLRLAPGWKTYWRAPGDAGIPPQFNWSGSRNLRDVQVHWPRPEVQMTNGMRTIGYQNEVILPLSIAPRKTDAPIKLNAKLEVGVCEVVCIPMTLRVRASLEGAGASDARIHDAMAQLPVTSARAGVGRVLCAVEPTSDGLRLTTRIAMPRLGRAEVVLFEPGDPSIWVSEPTAMRSGNTLTTVTELVPPSAQPFALNRALVRYTVLGGGQAVEITGCTAG